MVVIAAPLNRGDGLAANVLNEAKRLNVWNNGSLRTVNSGVFLPENMAVFRS
jgi:hypothetical protein